MKMVQKTTIVEYPNVPSILALVGGALIVLVDVFLLAIAIVVLPHLNYANFTSPRGYTGSPGSLASGFVSAIAIFGLICGIIVLLSSVMLRFMPAQRQTWGILRSEEHTSELQSQFHLVCRLLLEKKKKHTISSLHNIYQ